MTLFVAMRMSGINQKIAVRIIDKLISHLERWYRIIDSSFLSDELKDAYKSMVADRVKRLENKG